MMGEILKYFLIYKEKEIFGLWLFFNFSIKIGCTEKVNSNFQDFLISTTKLKFSQVCLFFFFFKIQTSSYTSLHLHNEVSFSHCLLKISVWAKYTNSDLNLF